MTQYNWTELSWDQQFENPCMAWVQVVIGCLKKGGVNDVSLRVNSRTFILKTSTGTNDVN